MQNREMRMSRENDLPVATAKQLEARNQKIISAVIEKADKLYPGTLALIGIYGSFMTGDIHEKSDLDLLILINDDRGWQLGCAFVQDDLQVGHDIYCTNWESLERDAAYTHPNISKLLDAKIVYCADEKYMEKLLALREEAKDRMQAAFSEADYEKAEQFLKEAECLYDRVMTAEKLSEAYAFAGKVLCLIENAIAMLNKAYFRYGRKRVFEELHQMKKRPENLVQLLGAVAAAENLAELQEALTKLLVETRKAFAHAGEAFENVGEMFEDVREVNAQAEIQQDETRVCAVLQEEKETATSPEDASGQQADKTWQIHIRRSLLPRELSGELMKKCIPTGAIKCIWRQKRMTNIWHFPVCAVLMKCFLR